MRTRLERVDLRSVADRPPVDGGPSGNRCPPHQASRRRAAPAARARGSAPARAPCVRSAVESSRSSIGSRKRGRPCRSRCAPWITRSRPRQQVRDSLALDRQSARSSRGRATALLEPVGKLVDRNFREGILRFRRGLAGVLSVLVWSMAVRLELRVRGCELQSISTWNRRGLTQRKPSARSESGGRHPLFRPGHRSPPPLSRIRAGEQGPSPCSPKCDCFTMTSAI